MKQLVVATLIACTALGASVAGDWPQWRGPNRDGAGAAFTEPAQWPEKLTERWKVTVGGGHSSPVLVGNRIYLHTRQQEQETIRAIDAATGKTVWQDQYP